jgi:hypothetical protein
VIGVLGALGHVAFSTGFGWALLSSRKHERTSMEMLLTSFLVGMYTETLGLACLLFLGLSFPKAAIATGITMCVVAAALLVLGHRAHIFPVFEKPKWYEWLLLAVAGEKVLFAMWQLLRTETYFDDALQHWSGRARELYGGVNWSIDPNSPFFLGDHIGSNAYPLGIPIWRAMSATLSGSWNEIASRADSVLFFVIVLGTTWLAIRRFANGRPLAAAAIAVLVALPLHAWHAAAGYADIGVEAFVVGALAALLRKEHFLAGLLLAGAVWTKSDGLVLYVPAFLPAVALIERFRWQKIARFLLGLATVTPWLLYNQMHSLGFTAGQGKFAWRAAAPKLLLKALTTSATSGFIWTFLIGAAIYLSWSMWKDSTGRGLIVGFGIVFGAILFTFTSTSAYEFLENEMTVHRVFMQFSGMTVIVVAYGASLIASTRNASPTRRANAANRS